MQKPLFVAIVRGGMLASIHMLNGDPGATYLVIDEDCLQETEAEALQELDTDAIVRQRLTTEPNQFLQAVDGAVDDPATLYPPDTFR